VKGERDAHSRVGGWACMRGVESARKASKGLHAAAAGGAWGGCAVRTSAPEPLRAVIISFCAHVCACASVPM